MYSKILSCADESLYGYLLVKFDDRDLPILDSVLTRVHMIGVNAFKGSSIEEVAIPNNVLYIQNGAFKDCKNLKKVSFDFQSHISSIPEKCFQNCSQLQTVEFPEKLSFIDNRAFKGCSALNNIEFWGMKINIDSRAFAKCSNLHTVQIQKGSQIANNAFDNGTVIELAELPYAPSYAEQEYKQYKLKLKQEYARKEQVADEKRRRALSAEREVEAEKARALQLEANKPILQQLIEYFDKQQSIAIENNATNGVETFKKFTEYLQQMQDKSDNNTQL